MVLCKSLPLAAEHYLRAHCCFAIILHSVHHKHDRHHANRRAAIRQPEGPSPAWAMAVTEITGACIMIGAPA